ncbi:MAG: hypothetical protein LUG56_05335 [Lachnospiraceae bacterium]|nr:hypothetical protein [Lachnospiraceae bacterium]MCD7841876.1 hypothetical protein [Lachnospiraceae bacterium]
MKSREKIFGVALSISVICVSISSDTGEIACALENIQTASLSELASTAEDMESIFDACDNLVISEDFALALPDGFSQVYEYITSTPIDVDMKEYYDDFIEMFECLFPNHELNDDYLFYTGGSSELIYDETGKIVQDFNKVEDWYEKLASGEEGRVNFLYDETWLRDMTEWQSPVCLELSNPIGFGYAVINKGKTVELNGARVYDEAIQAERYPLLESYDPCDWLEYVGAYSPDSRESFMLLDKETSIYEAVNFFEEYINALPCPDNANMCTVVTDVEVYVVTENVYGYYFLTTKEYQGLPFDHMRSGTQHSEFSDYTTTGGNAFMVESDDVDVVYGYYRQQDVVEERAFDEIVTAEAASRIISEKLTDSVVFEVEKMELVYTEMPGKTDDGTVDVENPSSTVSSAWKFTLYNPNDDLNYVCYIDAVDGDDFRYYKTPGNQE